MRFALVFITGVAAFGAEPSVSPGACPNLCTLKSSAVPWGKQCSDPVGMIIGNTKGAPGTFGICCSNIDASCQSPDPLCSSCKSPNMVRPFICEEELAYWDSAQSVLDGGAALYDTDCAGIREYYVLEGCCAP